MNRKLIRSLATAIDCLKKDRRIDNKIVLFRPESNIEKLQSIYDWYYNLKYFTMIRVPKGSFILNATDYLDPMFPPQRISIEQPFYISNTVITNRQWNGISEIKKEIEPEDLDKPVVNISYEDCLHFISLLNLRTNKNYRIPSVEEWELACRAGTKKSFYFGDSKTELRNYAWYSDNSKGLSKVGLKNPNKLGLYDMHGNVWEWTRTAHSSHSGRYHLIKGGSYKSDADACKCANNNNYNKKLYREDIGFRICLPY